jgi:GNAT superfamily N-acetyltransferase
MTLPEGTLATTPDNRHRLAFELPDGGSASYSYRIFGEHALLLGMLVQPRSRGQRIGEQLLNHAVLHFQNEGLQFAGTGLIHKPVIAHTLTRCGLQPEPGGALIELLPSSSRSKSHVPSILVLRPAANSDNVVIGSASGRFYKEVTVPEAKYLYPLHTPGPAVEIHTAYTPIT